MSEPPVVLHFITRYLDGGAETTTENTLEALATAADPYDLRLGTGADHDPEKLTALGDDGIETIVFDRVRHYDPVNACLAVFEVARYLRRADVDILHTHSTEAGVIGRLAGALAGTPVVVHEIHGDPITTDRHPALNRFLCLAERLAAFATDRFVVKSEQIRESYLGRGIGTRDRYELIYHGVDLDSFRQVATEQATDGRTDSDVLELLFVGRLADGKGLFDLFEGVEQISDVHLRVVGDGPLYEELRETAERRDLPVELLGHRDDVPRQMATADVLVLPSYREGTPRVVTEAMASGLPVVASDIAGLPEQVLDGETGYLVAPGDIDALVDRITALRDDDRRRAFGERGQEHVEMFSTDTAREEYRCLYRKLSAAAQR